MKQPTFGLTAAICIALGGVAFGQGLESGPGITPSQLNAQVQAGSVTTGTGGTWSITFAQPYANTPAVNPVPINTSGAMPIICNATSVTTIGASGTCWTAQTTGITLTALPLTINPISQTAAGITVDVFARNMTQ